MSLIYIQVNEINYLVSHKSKCNTIKHFIIIRYCLITAVVCGYKIKICMHTSL